MNIEENIKINFPLKMGFLKKDEEKPYNLNIPNSKAIIGMYGRDYLNSYYEGNFSLKQIVNYYTELNNKNVSNDSNLFVCTYNINENKIEFCFPDYTLLSMCYPGLLLSPHAKSEFKSNYPYLKILILELIDYKKVELK